MTRQRKKIAKKDVANDRIFSSAGAKNKFRTCEHNNVLINNNTHYKRDMTKTKHFYRTQRLDFMLVFVTLTAVTHLYGIIISNVQVTYNVSK